MIYLWKIEKNDIKLNLEELLKYDEFRIIYLRDKNPSKHIATQHFKYIDFIANRDSFPNREGYSESESRKFAAINSGLGDKFIADKDLNIAIAKARQLNGGIIENLLDNIIAAFRSDAQIVSKMRTALQAKVNSAATIEDFKETIKLSDTLVEISSTIPGKIDKFLTLREEYEKKLKTGITRLRGGGEISNSYDGGDFEELSDSGEVEKVD